jgi:hypothetical protein
MPSSGTHGDRMDDAAIDAFLREQGVGVLALADAGHAYAIPISFGYDTGRVVFGYFSFGDESRKQAYTEATEEACLTVTDVRSRYDWRSVVVTGPLSEVDPQSTDLGRLLGENAWSPDLSSLGQRGLQVRGYELAIEEATGYRGKRAGETTEE